MRLARPHPCRQGRARWQDVASFGFETGWWLPSSAGHVVQAEEVASHPGRPVVVRGVSREHKETGSRFLLGALVPPGMWGRVASEAVNKGLGPSPPPQGTGMAGTRWGGEGDLPQQSQPHSKASTLIAPRTWRRACPRPAVPRAASGPDRTACEGGRRHRAASRPATLLSAQTDGTKGLPHIPPGREVPRACGDTSVTPWDGRRLAGTLSSGKASTGRACWRLCRDLPCT